MALIACVATSAPAAVRGTLVIRGHVLDDGGEPLHQAWVFVRGSRRLSALTDSLGWFEISVPGGTVEELSRQPVSVRVQARRKGFRIVTKEGAAEIGIELSVRRDSSEVWRYQVRSNQPAVAAAIAAAAVLEANPSVTLDVGFIATPGSQVENLPEPLRAFEEVALVGPPPKLVERIAEPVVTPPAPPAPPPKATTVAVLPKATAHAHADSIPATRRLPTTPGVMPRERASVPAPRPAKESAARKEPAAGPVVVRPGEGGTERSRVYRPGIESHEDRKARKELERRERAEEKERKRVAKAARQQAQREEWERRVAAAKAEREARAAALKAEREGRGTPAAGATAAVEKGNAAAGEDGSGAERREPDGAGAASRLTHIEPRFHSRDGGTERVAAPEVPWTEAVACSCRVRGTIEIDADRPLPQRTRVEVWLEGLRDHSDRVELFMGSPRAFDLGWVPCGTRPIAFTTTSRQRFQVRLPEAVYCRAGTSIQVRVALEPYRRAPVR